MSSNIYSAGLGNVGSYQVSGMPYATGSLEPNGRAVGLKVAFPYVTRWVQVYNTDVSNALFVGFSSNGINADNAVNYYIELPPATAQAPIITTGRLELKLTEIWVSGSGVRSTSVVAGLTNLPVARINNIAINWSGSVGVG